MDELNDMLAPAETQV